MKQNGTEQKLLPLNQCKKIFVQRDYGQGLTVKFYTKLPPELRGRLDEQYFEKFVNDLNRIYADAERTGAESVFETMAGCLSCYLAHLCITMQYDKNLKRISQLLKDENDKVFIPNGLFVTDPIERGLRVIEISFLDEPSNPRPAPTS